MVRLFNPADLLALPAKSKNNPVLPETANPAMQGRAVPRKRLSPIRATQGTVRAMRLVRSAAVAKFGRGKTKLEYRQGRWVVHLYNYSGDAVGLYLAYDTVPGVEGTGIDFQIVPAARF